MEQLGSQWMDFYEILYLISFKISVEKIQVSLKSDKNNVFFFNHAIYEIMWKNVVQQGRPQMTI